MTTAGEPPSRHETEFSGSAGQLRFGALLWTERASWRELLDAAIAAEEAGFSSIWCSDHLVASTGPPHDPCFELWTTLAAIGTSTSRALIGPLVAAIALRNPGVTSKAVTTLDHITGGRAVLGLGSGWLKLEYESHGIPFGEGSALRARRLEEGIQIIQQLLAGETVTHHSECYEMIGGKARTQANSAQDPSAHWWPRPKCATDGGPLRRYVERTRRRRRNCAGRHRAPRALPAFWPPL